MKPFLNIQEFLPFFNQENLVSTGTAGSVTVKDEDYTASLAMRGQQSLNENHTVRFTLKFEHKRHLAEQVFQREFLIEHHHDERHGGPHVQVHIHGPAPEHKVGELWMTLPLATEEDYTRCIKGFFNALEPVIESCQPGLVDELLNREEVERLTKERAFLVAKISESLRNKGIEYKDARGNKTLLAPANVERLIRRDATIEPLFLADK